MKKLLFSASCLIALSTPLSAENTTNIIYMIGDGMGPSYTTAYRYFKDDKNTPEVERTIFDSLFTGLASTSPDDHTVVTDSAAGATALATSTKSYNGAIAVDKNKNPLKTMLQMAKENGLTTALVATSQINHATPASFVAHNEYRRNYNDIANDYVDVKVNNQLPVDLLLGGGTKYFIREDRNLVSELKLAGYQYESDINNLNAIESLPAIGLFNKVALPYAIDKNPKRLTKMTAKTLSLLDKDSRKGFFAMIEASQIDWCGHANDIACAMAEMDDFATSIELVKSYIDKNPNTLLVVTADHSTGGLTLGSDGVYEWKADVIKNVKASGEKIAKALVESNDYSLKWIELTGIELAEEAKNSLSLNIKEIKNSQQKSDRKEALEQLAKFTKMQIDIASRTGWTTSGHTAIDVPILAYGKGSEAFRGHMDNTDIAKKLIRIIKQ